MDNASGSAVDFPYLIWNIRNFYSVRRLETDTYTARYEKFNLVLKLECFLNSDDDCYDLRFVRETSGGMKMFPACVYIKDKFGNNHFRQDVSDVTNILYIPNKRPLWSVKRKDLLAKSDVLLQENGTVRIICMLGPESEHKTDGDQELEKEHRLVETTSELSCIESLSQDLHNYLVKDVKPDVLLKCGDDTFPAHRSMLSARSSVFKAMFQNDMTEKLDGFVNIKDMVPAHLKEFLHYIYTGTFSNLVEENASYLYAAASKYAVEALKKKCAKFLMERITENDALSLVALADAHSDEDFKKRVISFIVMNNKILKDEDWFRFSGDHAKLSIEIYRAYMDLRSK